MYRKFRNVPIFEDFSPICPYFLGFRVGKYVNVVINFPLNWEVLSFAKIEWRLDVYQDNSSLEDRKKIKRLRYVWEREEEKIRKLE